MVNHMIHSATDAADPRPFFIFGAGRSGTSLLSRMLGHHPNLAVPPESHLYAIFHPWLKYYGDLRVSQNRADLVEDIIASGPIRDWSPQLEPDEVLARIDGEGFGAVVEAVMAAWAAKVHKPRWGEKTPKHVRYWREISTDFEDPPVIHIVRDGRDCALSLMEARFGPKSLYACAREWKKYLKRVEAVKRSLPPERFYETSYERLLRHTEDVLRDICAFLGETYTPEMLQFYQNTAPYPTDVRNRQNLTRPLLAGNTEKWRSQMDQDELRVFEAVAGNALVRYGYQRAISDCSMSRQEEWCRRYLEAPYRRSIGRFKDRKGQRERLIQVRLLARRVVMRPFVARSGS
jgi:hypothetical protein